MMVGDALIVCLDCLGKEIPTTFSVYVVASEAVTTVMQFKVLTGHVSRMDYVAQGNWSDIA
jgi:hypothetical protein